MSFSLTDITRQPVCQLLALNEDLSTAMDLTSYMKSADLSFTDEVKSHVATFVLANPQGFFDKLGNAAGAAVLVENRIIQFHKGFKDLATGTNTLFPAFYGRITMGSAQYMRNAGEVITITVFDNLKNLLKQRITTNQYYNTQTNLIAADIALQYGKISGTNLAVLDYVQDDFQAPDMTVPDILSDLYGPPLYFVWTDYQGRLATRPRLGSAASGAPGYVGFPDAAAPPAQTPDFTFSDAHLVESLGTTWQDHEFVNQVRVLGESLAEEVGAGPLQLLTNVGDSFNESFLSAGDGKQFRLYFSQQNSSTNIFTALNIYVKIIAPSLNNFGGPGYKYLCLNQKGQQAISNDTGALIPTGPYEDTANGSSPSIKIIKGDGSQEGGFILQAVAPNLVQLLGYANSDGGGFNFAIEVWGQPVITSDQTLTKIVDYNPVTVTGETLTDVFGDHQTYQASHAPFAMGTPVELRVNPSSLLTTTLTSAANAGDQVIHIASAAGLTQGAQLKLGTWTGGDGDYPLVQSVAGAAVTLEAPLAFAHASAAAVTQLTGIVSADGLYGSTLFKADFERGRVVFTNRTYLNYAADSLYTGGSSGTNGTAWNLQYATIPAAPVALYQSYRTCPNGQAFSYSFTGLQVGRGYLLRLHLADPDPNAANGTRVFAVYVNGVVQNPSVDITAQIGGKNRAYVLELTGQVPDNTGTMVVSFQNGGIDGGAGQPICSGMEVVLPQGTGGVAFAINSGGPAIVTSVPVVQMTSAYSPVQQTYGINQMEVDNPLLKTLAQCVETGTYFLNMSAWARNPVLLKTASIPPIEPGMLIKYFQPRLGANGADLWAYVQSIHRYTERADPKSETVSSDYDEYGGYLLYRQFR